MLKVNEVLETTSENINISIIDHSTKELLSYYDGKNSIDLMYNDYEVKYIDDHGKTKLIFV